MVVVHDADIAGRAGVSTNCQFGAITQAAKHNRVLLNDGHDEVRFLAVDAGQDKL